MTFRPRILFAAGGTGGHVYPAIAIAREIREMNPEAAIMFAGTRERLEWNVVPEAGYEIAPIAAAGLQRSLTPRNLIMPFKVIKGLGQSISLIRAFDPDVVVGTGGFVAGPVLAAALLLGRKTLIQEQNAYPGMTNRLFGRTADAVHVAFPEAASFFPDEHCVISGNPTRAELLAADRHEARAYFDVPEGGRVLFAVGGSLGSQALNDVLLRTCFALTGEGAFVIWQTGPRYYDRVRQGLGEDPQIRLLEYVERMDLAYAAADLVLCRSGAITCSELLATGTPAVLVPSPNVAEDHQTKNALSLEEAGCALMIPEPELEPQVGSTVKNLLFDTERLATMAHNARRSAHPRAATDIAAAVLHLAARPGNDVVNAL